MTPDAAVSIRPSFPVGRSSRVAGCLGVVGLLSACSSGRNISASQEASRYAETARADYVAPGSANDPWGPYIHEASDRYDVPERWIREVMRVESGGHAELNGRPITSGAGAMGLMQVMPATYDELRGRYDLGSDPYDPHNSIQAGAAYIRELYDLYGSPGFLAAYNGGPGRLDDYLTRDRPLADETRRYVAKIGPYITDSFPRKRSVAEQYAMNSLPASIPAGPRYPGAGNTAIASYVPPPRPEPATAPAGLAPSGPVEVAYAPSNDSGAAFDPPPGWTPVRMSRAEVASYVPPPSEPAAAVAVAPVPPESVATASELPPPSYAPPLYGQSYQPFRVASEPPAPRAAALRAPEMRNPEMRNPELRNPELRNSEPRNPEPRVAEFHAVEPRTQVAALPEPPPFVPNPQTAAAYEPQTLQHRENGYRLVPAALAAPAPMYRGNNGHWAIQVGAFGNEGLAHTALASAREQAPSALAGSRPAVAGVREPHGTLYRARLVGLSRDAASQACQRLNHKTSCIVLSPEAQS